MHDLEIVAVQMERVADHVAIVDDQLDDGLMLQYKWVGGLSVYGRICGGDPARQGRVDGGNFRGTVSRRVEEPPWDTKSAHCKRRSPERNASRNHLLNTALVRHFHTQDYSLVRFW